MAIFALIDANSFYASCEIAFQPGLVNRPVVVLSNNDGCIVAANAHAKALNRYLTKPLGAGGYRAAQPSSIMFQPYFKVERLLKAHKTKVFSSNYELYADMSQRLHTLIGQFAPKQEIYSIDESFLDLTDFANHNLTDYGQQIRQTILRGLGLPVAVGIGRSKTLAKLANHLAKKGDFSGVLDLTALSEPSINLLLKNVAIGDIWGIGKQLRQQLQNVGIDSALDLKLADPNKLSKRFSVNILRSHLELNNQACLQLDEIDEPKQQILRSRSFGQAVSERQYLRQALVSFASRAAEKLRAQDSVCQAVTVFCTTNPFKPEKGAYRNSCTLRLAIATDDTRLIAEQITLGVDKLWRDGYLYHKAGVILSELSQKSQQQNDLFAPTANPKSATLMAVMDQINQKMGKHSLHLASQGHDNQRWAMRQNHHSPRYTTNWQELLTVS